MPQLLFFVAHDESVSLSSARAANESGLAKTAYVACNAQYGPKLNAKQLAELLDAESTPPPSRGWLVLPRPGMASAWSSKACSLAQRCGVEGIALLERAAWHVAERPSCDRLLETVIAYSELVDWLDASQAIIPSAAATADLTVSELASKLHLQFDDAELDRLTELFGRLKRTPTEAELLLLAQTNSEHCRHKTFRASISGCGPATPLFETIRSTHRSSPSGTLAAYDDNAAVLELGIPRAFGPIGQCGWGRLANGEPTHTVIKAETHNHPTGISPYPGAATGVGGEIRDEAAAGRGAASHAGFAGFMLSDLHVQDAAEPWEKPRSSFPQRLSRPLQILINAPLGAAAFSNEFGRPTLAGFLRTFEHQARGEHFGYHKPVMIAGGMGEIGQGSLSKLAARPGDLIVQLGGPGLRIGVAGGAASSNAAAAELDFASVQRDNAEMQRRAQEVINACRLGKSNPLRALHDVGAGGLGNAVAELAGACGSEIRLAAVPVGQPNMTPAEILCNEAQERYVATVAEADLAQLADICRRERCPLAVLGAIASNGRMRVLSDAGEAEVDLPCPDIFGGDELPSLQATAPALAVAPETSLAGISLAEAVPRVLRHPAVADKSFLVTIADRTVGGLTARDQLVGPWQTAVADCAVTFADFSSDAGRALAVGERPAIAVADPAASARLAIAEALTNLAAADVADLGRVRLSLNWMAACDSPQAAGELVAGVRGACDDFLSALGISVPVGKDSLSMRTHWEQPDGSGDVRAPLTCVCTAFAAAADANATWTPQLADEKDTVLMLLRAGSKRRMGFSVLAQAFGCTSGEAPDIAAADLKALWEALRAMRRAGIVLAYHDISDGGLLAAAAEMGFAANCGVTLMLDALCQPQMGLDADGCEQSTDATAPGGIERIVRELFCEETGAVIQVRRTQAAAALSCARDAGLDASWPQTVGWPNRDRRLRIVRNGSAACDESIDGLRQQWSSLGARIRALRDDPACAAEEAARDFASDSGLFVSNVPTAQAEARGNGSRAAAVVLRDQGTNGQLEMAAALDRTGFNVQIVAMTDLAADPSLLDSARMLALPGGFSFGDTLGAGRGQAQTILHAAQLRETLGSFFARNTLTLGVCNGCQVLAQLACLLPSSARCSFPRMLPNRSRRFEARLSMVEVLPSPSLLLQGLAGAMLPVPVSSGEGRAVFEAGPDEVPQAAAAMRYVGNDSEPAELHPLNPSGSDGGLCGFASPDGRLTLLMPHPERAVRAGQLSWRPASWQGDTPWLRMFEEAYAYCAQRQAISP